MAFVAYGARDASAALVVFGSAIGVVGLWVWNRIVRHHTGPECPQPPRLRRVAGLGAPVAVAIGGTAVVPEATLTATGEAVVLWPLTTPEEARNSQDSVDQGHPPWHLEPDAVILALAEAVLGYETTAIDEAASEGETTRVTDNAGRAADVAGGQPARTGSGGIWAVVAVASETT